MVDSPYSASTKEAFVFDDAHSITQLVQELQVANSSTFLVAGYRGVGKTSFVKRLAETLIKTHICAVLNVAKYVSYQALVKRLIRELYLQFKDHPIAKTEALEALSNEFLLLYDRTFNDIANSQVHNIKNETKVETEIKIDYKKLIIPIIAFISLALNLGYKVIPYSILNVIIFLGGSAWAGLTTWNLGITKGKTSTTTIETSIKTLYDDEIAEHFLFEILRKLKENGIKVIIGFDELDKHEKTESISKVIDDLKPLLLSGDADFFIITGQQLNYLFEEAALKENEVISSIFSKVIYVPFLRHATLLSFCHSLVAEELKNDERLATYFDSLILQSRRIPRRLTNLIRSELKWRGGCAYILLEDHRSADHSFDTKLLNCLTAITENMLPKIAKTDAQLDFFVAQIHIWALKMKAYGSVHFLMSEVIDEKSYERKIPAHYFSQLDGLSELLTDELMMSKMLGIKHQDDMQDESFYFWKNNSDSVQVPTQVGDAQAIDDNFDDQPIGDDFIADFANLEALIRQICVEIDPAEDSRNYTLKQLIGYLRSYDFFEVSTLRAETVDEVISVRNKIVHGHVIGEEAKLMGQKAQFNLNRLKAEILEEYAFHVAKNLLDGFEFTKPFRNVFDFSAVKDGQIILFDVKYRAKGRLSTNEIEDIITNFERFFKGTTYSCRYVLFCFIPGDANDFKLYNSFNKIVDEKFPKLKDKIDVVAIVEKSSFGIGPSIKKIVADIIANQIDIQERNYRYFTDEEIAQSGEIINQEAKKAWPNENDFDMQLNYADSEGSALDRLRSLKDVDVSASEWEVIVAQSKNKWPRSFSQQLRTFQTQVNALQDLKRLEPSPISIEELENIQAKSKLLYPLDYASQLDETVRQKQALMLINDLKPERVPADVLDKFKADASIGSPNDYEKQYQTILKCIEEYLISEKD